VLLTKSDTAGTTLSGLKHLHDDKLKVSEAACHLGKVMKQ
jgi:hypothetical protein